MIKVNLSQVSGFVSAGAPAGGAGFSMSGNRDQFPKVFALFIFTALIFAYEKYDLSQRHQKLRVVQEQHEAIQKEVSQYGSIRTVVDDLAKERDKLNSQLEIIQRISKKRAAKLSTIVQIQKDLPADVWLTKLDIDSFRAKINGYARTPTSVQQLVGKLNEYEFLVEALNQELKRVKVNNEEIQEFDILAKVKQ